MQQVGVSLGSPPWPGRCNRLAKSRARLLHAVARIQQVGSALGRPVAVARSRDRRAGGDCGRVGGACRCREGVGGCKRGAGGRTGSACICKRGCCNCVRRVCICRRHQCTCTGGQCGCIDDKCRRKDGIARGWELCASANWPLTCDKSRLAWPSQAPPRRAEAISGVYVEFFLRGDHRWRRQK